MKKMYIIIRENIWGSGDVPYDVVSSFERAHELCRKYEAKDPRHVYDVMEVMSSEE